MKESKFRAYDKIDKRLIIDKQDFIPLIVTNKGVFKLDPCCEYNRWIEIEEDRFVIMEYTGLKDKNRVLIFEGDIVTTPYRDTNGYIYYSAPVFGLKDKTGVCIDFTWEDFNEFEVIGNIYENPELLNTKG